MCLQPFLAPARSLLLSHSHLPVMAKGAKRVAEKIAAASPDEKRRKLTVEQRAQQKLRENFGSLTEEEREAVVSSDGHTLRATLEKDIKRSDAGEDVTFGKWYFEGLRTEFRTEKSVFNLLSPPKDNNQTVAPTLMEAAYEPWTHIINGPPSLQHQVSQSSFQKLATVHLSP